MKLEGTKKDEYVERLISSIFPEGTPTPAQQNQGELSSFSTQLGGGQSRPAKELSEHDFQIAGMVCPACAWIIHYALSRLKGVFNVNVNFINEHASLEYDPMILGKEQIEECITRVGYRPFDQDQEKQGGVGQYNFYRFGAGWFLTLNAMMFSFVVYSAENHTVPPIIQMICSILLFILATLTPFIATPGLMRSGFFQITHGRFQMESLIVLSSSAAWLYSTYALLTGQFASLYFEVVNLLLMITETGNLISSIFYQRLYRRIVAIRFHLPQKARIISSGSITFKPLKEICSGDLLEVHEGEIVPVDGILLGDGNFDFSVITGESEVVHLEAGRFVGSGAKVIGGKCQFKIPDHGVSSRVEGIIDSTIAGFNTQRPHVSLGDKIGRYFVPFVFLIAVSTLLWHFSSDLQTGLTRAICVLIIACPCAFGIAEPLVIISAINRIRKFGIHFYNGNALTTVPDAIVFDKTGTLTLARPKIIELFWLHEKKQQHLDILASLERGINHPIANALSALGEHRNIVKKEQINTTITGECDGVTYLVGKQNLFPGIVTPAHLEGHTLVFFGTTSECLLIIALEDEIRPESHDLVEGLMKAGKEIYLCSGDRKSVVERTARALKITNFNWEMTGQSKKLFIESLSRQGRKVMMIGDGINDTESLIAADIGLAVLGGQTPAAMSADAIFITPNLKGLSALPMALDKIRSKIWQNYGWAFLYNFIGIGLSISGKLSPSFCALGMAISNCVVIANSFIWANFPGPTRQNS
ncbi:MAG: hypothetical protein A2X86_00310 [Bdellovibrionales bacterium GWA2_49_15]|nr:MAG: hypothetical protein A2X86_00310 [Bdellovibrionales bacterium GWA2_49_15]HAZ14485.1 hypothetical protein [Bdellovibrionales bacterium]